MRRCEKCLGKENKLKTWEYSKALNCVVLQAEAILRGREFHTGTMRDEKKKRKTFEYDFQLPAVHASLKGPRVGALEKVTKSLKDEMVNWWTIFYHVTKIRDTAMVFQFWSWSSNRFVEEARKSLLSACTAEVLFPQAAIVSWFSHGTNK